MHKINFIIAEAVYENEYELPEVKYTFSSVNVSDEEDLMMEFSDIIAKKIVEHEKQSFSD
jgi:hypothetical protein